MTAAADSGRTAEKAGGIVLCGGQSRRMGRAKAQLPFGPESILARVVRRIAGAVNPIVVAAASCQDLPPLPEGVHVVRDRRPDRGPLEALSVGLAAMARLRAETQYAFVCSCDVPLLEPAFVDRLISFADGCDVAVPHVAGRDHPLVAVYRVGIQSHVEWLLDADRLSLRDLLAEVDTRRVTASELRDVDPELRSLANVNEPAEYLAALRQAGLRAPDDQ